MDDPWLNWIRKVQAIAQTGLTYSEGHYDLDRYTRLRELCLEMLDRHACLGPGQAGELYSVEVGPATPRVDVRAVVFRGNQVLLVKEVSDGLWSLPGGWAEVGESAADSAVREAFEESGYRTRPVKLLGVFLRENHHPPIAYSCYRMFFRCELLDGVATPSMETSEVGFFGRDQLPPLSTGRVTEWQLERCFEHRLHPDWPTDFE